jgi:hypothetical protein
MLIVYCCLLIISDRTVANLKNVNKLVGAPQSTHFGRGVVERLLDREPRDQVALVSNISSSLLKQAQIHGVVVE